MLDEKEAGSASKRQQIGFELNGRLSRSRKLQLSGRERRPFYLPSEGSHQ